MKFSFYVLSGMLAIGAIAGAVPQTGQETPPASPPASAAATYRLRVENAEYGRIELSADDGQHYALIGRALRPALTIGTDRSAAASGVVLRSSGDGLAFSIASGQAMKLLPRQSAPPATRRGGLLAPPLPSSALPTNLEPRQGLFAELLPPKGTPVRLQRGAQMPIAFPEDYRPAPDDMFVFTVTLPSGLPPDAVLKRIEILSQAYAAGAVARAKAARRTVASGILTLRAKLPEGEPDPIAAVTFSVEGDVVSAQNVPPFVYAWDTRRVPDGEYVVEIRALSGRATPISRVRALVAVHNASTP
jgi:hypothetical protein